MPPPRLPEVFPLTRIDSAGRSRWEWLALLLILSLALWLRVSFVRTVDVPNFADPLDYQARGLHFATHFDFRGSSYRAPGYVAFVGLHYLLFGFRDRPIYLSQALLSTALVLLLYLIARRAFGRAAGLTAGLLAALFPPFIGYSGALFAEVLFLTLTTAGVWLAIEADARLTGLPTDAAQARSGPAEPSGWRRPALWAAASGAALGLAALTRSIVLPLAVLLPLWLVVPYPPRRWGGRSAAAAHPAGSREVQAPWRLRLKVAAVGFAAFLVVLLPWTVRNTVVFHRVVPVDTVAGLNLLIGNHPRANGTFSAVDYLDAYQKAVWNPNEAERDKLFMAEAVRYIRSHPGAFLTLTLLRWRAFWAQVTDYIEPLYHWERIPLVGRHDVGVVYQTVLFALGLAGLALSWRHRHALLFGLGALYVAAAQSVFYEVPRYRLPAVPFLILLTAYLLSRRPRWWLVPGLALAGVFYFWLLRTRVLIGPLA
ncbi:MAG: glycosyltransferase family 39 protein [Bacillota bacterium]